MTDEELIKLLRAWDESPFDDDAHAAADRIKQLVKERDRVVDKWSNALDREVILNKKLAKAVEVLRHSRAACLEAWGSHGAIHIDAVLAELEKQND